MYQISTRRGAFVLRVWRSAAAVLDEARLRFLASLAAQDLPVVRPIQRSDGAYSGSFAAAEQPWVATLYVFVPGATPGRAIAPEEAEACIRTISGSEEASLPLFVGLRHLLMTGKIIAYAQQGIDTGHAITADFIARRLAQVQDWINQAE